MYSITVGYSAVKFSSGCQFYSIFIAENRALSFENPPLRFDFLLTIP
jgi:hypothetical protein